jgi:hypothetical protein
MQDETLGYLFDPELAPAAAEVLAGKLFTHGKRPTPRRIVVDATGCCGGVCIDVLDATASREATDFVQFSKRTLSPNAEGSGCSAGLVPVFSGSFVSKEILFIGCGA